MTKKQVLAIVAIVLLAAALTYLFYAGSAEKKQLSEGFMNSRVIPIVAEFGLCTQASGLAPCQEKVIACGISIKAEENDWTAIPQETALKCVSDLATSEEAKVQCSSYVEKAYDLAFTIRRENDLLFALFGSDKVRMRTNSTLEALGDCTATLQAQAG